MAFIRGDMDGNQKDILETMRKMMQQINPQKPGEAKAEESDDEEEKKAKKRKNLLDFHLKPRDVKQYLDRFVIEQDDAKKVLSSAVCDHYNNVRRTEEGNEPAHYAKQNVLMLGPTGVGKTYLIKCLADLIGVPFVKADATKFSETGYVGGDVEDLVRDLVQSADGDMDLARYGMIYIDEVDKIATVTSGQGRDVSGGGVQRGLLKLMEETEVPLRASNDMQGQIQAMMEYQRKGKITKPMISTKHILFIVSGAFAELPPITERRLRNSQIGFASRHTEDLNASNLFRRANTEDFIKFGFEPEFIGRLPVRVVCDPLSHENLFKILGESEGSVLRQYLESFAAYGIKAEVKEDAMREIAKMAEKEGTGARGLITVCERIFREFKYELPSSHIRNFCVDSTTLRDLDGALNTLLASEPDEAEAQIQAEIDFFETQFKEKNNVTIEFDEAARRFLMEKNQSGGMESLQKFLTERFSNYPYGLNLIQNKKAREKFLLGKDAIETPDAVLDAWVKECYDDQD